MGIQKSSEDQQSLRRYRLSYLIIGFSLLILLLSIFFREGQSESLKHETIFTAIIGLVGTWVGTILAFYYSKDNFEAASQSTKSLIDKIAKGDKLNSYVAKDYMIRLNDFSPLMIEDDNAETKLLLKDILSHQLTKFNRLPVFKKSGAPKYIIHRSIIDKFIAENAINNVDVATLTLNDLTKSKYGDQIKAFSIAKQTDYLISIKALMESLSEPEENILCSDAFITEKGSRSGKVIGWITNAIINEQAQM